MAPHSLRWPALALSLAAGGCATGLGAQPLAPVGDAAQVVSTGGAPPALPWLCPADGLPMAPVAPAFFGVSAKDVHADNPLLPAIAARLAVSGLGRAGSKIHWEYLEPAPGELRWELYDPQLTALAGAGLGLAIELRGTAFWASSQPTDGRPQAWPPLDLADWQAFVDATVRRYGPPGGGPVRDWEIWNEPNGWRFWRGTPEQYVELLNAAHAAVKALDPGARVWAPAVVFHPWNLASARAWVETVVAAGEFDVLSVHFYLEPAAMMAVAADLRDLLAAAGRPDTPIHVTEVNTPRLPSDCPGYGGQPEAEHAAELAAIFTCLANAGVAEVLYFVATDTAFQCPAPNDGLRARAGLLDEDACPKDRYWTLRALAQGRPAVEVFSDGFEDGGLTCW